jgi:hypothetical protein
VNDFILVPLWVRLQYHRRSQDLQRGSFLQRGVVLSKIPDFHGQFKKKNSGERNFTVNFKDFFPMGGSFAPPTPPAYAYAVGQNDEHWST